uniref:Ubiquitin-like domain-containing protein n=1 Tax=Globodera rostochiensis TaxID=31243 RepID=A0A914HUD1_GLORO
MDIFAFCEQFSSIEHTIAYMRNRGLLRQIAPICGRNGCRRRMTQVKNATFVYDGYQWRCPTHKGQKISIRAGSFFENAHFELRKGLMLGYYYRLSSVVRIAVKVVIISGTIAQASVRRILVKSVTEREAGIFEFETLNFRISPFLVKSLNTEAYLTNTMLNLSISTNKTEFPYLVRYPATMALVEFKIKLELVVGVYTADMKMELRSSDGKFIAELIGDDRTLEELGVQDQCIVHVHDNNETNDVPSGDAQTFYAIPEDKYANRKDTARKWKQELLETTSTSTTDGNGREQRVPDKIRFDVFSLASVVWSKPLVKTTDLWTDTDISAVKPHMADLCKPEQ